MKVRAFVVALIVLTSQWLMVSAQSQKDLFEFLQPTVQFSVDEKRQLAQRNVIVKILPASGPELAAVAATALNIGPDVFVGKIRNIAQLKKSTKVPEIGRFSSPPSIDDLQQLTLDEVDLSTIDRCQPDRCSLKFNGTEIEQLKRAAGTSAVDQKDAVEREFRQILLARTKRFLEHGPEDTKSQFQTLLQHSPFVLRAPKLANYVEQYPKVAWPGAETFLYWSKETYAWKPMITVTHVTILRGTGDSALPEVLVISRDIFASRYTGGSLVLASLIRDPSADAKQRYLVYVNRTWVDGVRALWRPFVEYRVKAQAKKVFTAARDRFETTGPMTTE